MWGFAFFLYFITLNTDYLFFQWSHQCLFDVTLRISFCGGRSQAGVREVLPPRKSLRLQNKEAEVLTLPPEPKGVLSYEKVAAYKKNLIIYFSHLNWSHSTAAFNSVSSISFSCRSFFSLFLLLTSYFTCVKVLGTQETSWPSAYGCSQHGWRKQAAFTTFWAVLWGRRALLIFHVLIISHNLIKFHPFIWLPCWLSRCTTHFLLSRQPRSKLKALCNFVKSGIKIKCIKMQFLLSIYLPFYLISSHNSK